MEEPLHTPLKESTEMNCQYTVKNFENEMLLVRKSEEEEYKENRQVSPFTEV